MTDEEDMDPKERAEKFREQIEEKLEERKQKAQGGRGMSRSPRQAGGANPFEQMMKGMRGQSRRAPGQDDGMKKELKGITAELRQIKSELQDIKSELKD